MPELAKSFEFVSSDQVPTIDGVEIPWYIAHHEDAMPKVQVHPNSSVAGLVHILWLPILIDSPIPEYGIPEGADVEVAP